MEVTGTHFNYYLICQRKLWLFASGINMEHTSEAVYEGKLIHETSYKQRSERFKEISTGGIKIDWFDTKQNVVHEIKKSDKREEAHIWQVKYYLYVLEQNGINASGLLEYPRLRKKEEVLLTTPDREYIKEATKKIEQIIAREQAPEKIKISRCRGCSYFDFCYSGEL
ncbi:CRISPR-associated exonuclease, Cas4 family [Mariniphaga anaerophila]|uniref:CRISPR-associated exonuclease Cas4 n=1 Tax=Mariniphaga anaerophila TaxID=1484053 RepID=A0A1M4WQQ0_9BACT|nr:CRISPR-associated protein Cas4 [Mariniphaga anaerophila]SHE83510.1 CRISPR-associated exonuclease, Cas4 family [Mariniphaga anaerophila]